MGFDPQSTLIIALAPGDDEFITTVKRHLAELGHPNCGVIVLKDREPNIKESFGDIEWISPHPIHFTIGPDPVAIAEAERINQEFLEKAILVKPSGVSISVANYFMEMQQHLLMDAGRGLEASLPKVEIQLHELKKAVDLETEPAKQGKKGKGFVDPRSRIISKGAYTQKRK